MLNTRSSEDHINRQYCFGTIDQEERRLSCHLAGLSTKPPDNRIEFFHPTPFGLLQLIKDTSFKTIQDHCVGALNLSVSLRMHHRCITDLNTALITVSPKSKILKVDPKSVIMR